MYYLGYSVIALTSLYFTFFVYRFLKNFFDLSKWSCCLLYILVFILSRPAYNLLSLFGVIYFHLFFISLALEIVYHFLKKYQVIKLLISSGVICVCIVSLMMAYGYYNMHHVRQTNYEIESSKIDDLKLAYMADLHMGTVIKQKELKDLCQRISSQNVDYVFLGGDIFDETTSLKQMKDACKIFGTIKSKKGVYYVYGNHDKNYYNPQPPFGSKDVHDELEKNQVHVLKDQTFIENNVTIIGRDDARFYNDSNRLKMKDLIKGSPKDNYTIVLDHQPLELQQNASLGIDLELSGHTHGGQIFPQGQFQSLLTDTLVYGEKTIGNFHAITSSGLSGWRYPIKTGACCEYLIINIK